MHILQEPVFSCLFLFSTWTKKKKKKEKKCRFCYVTNFDRQPWLDELTQVWFTQVTQTQMQMKWNAQVNGNWNVSACANTRNEKFSFSCISASISVWTVNIGLCKVTIPVCWKWNKLVEVSLARHFGNDSNNACVSQRLHPTCERRMDLRDICVRIYIARVSQTLSPCDVFTHDRVFTYLVSLFPRSL